jgi:hypothetical protein
MVDDATAWELLNDAQTAAEQAAFRTINTLREEWYRSHTALLEAAERLDQFEKYTQERGPEKFRQEDTESVRAWQARLRATDEVLDETLERLTNGVHEPRLVCVPAKDQDA